ncbi:uncharacterized protein LOC144007633 [Festucalex cinctus]
MASSNDEDGNTPQPQGQVESAVRNLVSLLLNTMQNNNLTRPTETGHSAAAAAAAAAPPPPPPPPPPPQIQSLEHEMTRSFPGYFKSNFRKGKKRCLTPSQNVRTTIRQTTLHFYLLPKHTSHTPLPIEELELLQAGMGRQTVTLPEDGDHNEISRLLAETFPKMRDLSGGWLLYKSTGGGGRRKLVVIPPETEGYSTKALRAISANGKNTFYIVPLQETLDTSPLPLDSQHFTKMPKQTCYQCNKGMPLQMLAVHIKTCKGNEFFDEMGDESSDQLSIVDKGNVDPMIQVCPICLKEFPEDEITYHASLCGESFDSGSTNVADDQIASTSSQTPVFIQKKRQVNFKCSCTNILLDTVIFFYLFF